MTRRLHRPGARSVPAIVAVLCLCASVALAAPPPGKGKPGGGGGTEGALKCASDVGKRHSHHARCTSTSVRHVAPELFVDGVLQSGWTEVFTEEFTTPPAATADRSGTFDVTRWSSRFPWGDWRANGVSGEDHWNVNTSGHDPGVGWVEGNYFPDMDRFISILEADDRDVFSRTSTGLSIRAHRNPWKKKINGRKPYVAGTLSTHVKPDPSVADGTHGRQWRYGYFEARMKMPRQGNGIRAAFWLYADNAFYNSVYGPVGRDEIDIAEYIANTRKPNPNDAAEECFVQQTSSFWPNVGADGALSYDSLFHTYHPDVGGRTSSNWVYNAQSPYDAIRCDEASGPDIIDFGAAYHTYGVLWEEDRLEFYVDRRLVHQVREDSANPSGLPANLTENGKAVYDGTMYLIANLALGLDGFEGNVDASVLDTPDETALGIDYVRVWQRTNSNHGWCGKGGNPTCRPGELTIPGSRP